MHVDVEMYSWLFQPNIKTDQAIDCEFTKLNTILLRGKTQFCVVCLC